MAHPFRSTASPARSARRLNRALFDWHSTERRTLLVREAAAPWPVLVAEVMSQQTQIRRVGRVWAQFVERWPAPADLAAASPRDVVLAWAGLGYNRRALALQRAARLIVERHDGRVPATVAELERLPGIGPYTARAVAAIAFGLPVAPLDVNVRRVVVRLTGAAGTAPQLQAAADDLVAREDPRRWVEAVMDLAAAVCTARAPACPVCPVRAWCRSRDVAMALPRTSQRPADPPFPATNRWLRGRLLAWLRDAPTGTWVESPTVLGEHGPERIGSALEALAADGFVEIDGSRARLRA